MPRRSRSRHTAAAHLPVIPALLDHLRRHPVGGANEGVAFGQRARQLSGHPEIRNLDGRSRPVRPMVAQQDVPAFDIPVDLAQGVKVGETLREVEIDHESRLKEEEIHRYSKIFVSEAWTQLRHRASFHLQCLATYVRNHILPEGLPADGDKVGHTPATAVLHYYPKLRAVLKALLHG